MIHLKLTKIEPKKSMERYSLQKKKVRPLKRTICPTERNVTSKSSNLSTKPNSPNNLPIEIKSKKMFEKIQPVNQENSPILLNRIHSKIVKVETLPRDREFNLNIDRIKSKIKKVKQFWDKEIKNPPHLFRSFTFDKKSKGFFFQKNDLGLKETNQKLKDLQGLHNDSFGGEYSESDYEENEQKSSIKLKRLFLDSDNCFE